MDINFFFLVLSSPVARWKKKKYIYIYIYICVCVCVCVCVCMFFGDFPAA